MGVFEKKKARQAHKREASPPFKKGQPHFQFTPEQNEDGYKIASVRVHVERAIERMKRFQPTVSNII